MPQPYDAVIVGGGHNGLVCAAYLARAGRKVKVLERRSMVGGAAVTEEFHPGFRNSICSYTVSLLSPKVISDLNLYDQGLKIIRRPVSNFLPTLDGRHVTLYPDFERTKEEFARHSAADAARFADYEAAIQRLADCLKQFLLETPPNAGGGWLELLKGFKPGRRLLAMDMETQRDLADIMTLSAADFLARWFENDLITALFAFDGIVGSFASPYQPGTAYILLHHCFGEVNGEKGAWGHAIGGMGAISEAIAASAKAAGAEIETDAPVQNLIIENARARGVLLADGREIRGKVVAANVNPKLLFQQLVPEDAVPADFRRRIDTYKSMSGTFRMNVALGELPDFLCLPGHVQAGHHGAGIIMAPSLAYMEEAYRDARDYGYARRPIVEMLIPSTIDDSLAPSGLHVASLFCQHFLAELPNGRTWADEREVAAAVIIDLVNEFAPNFRAAILGQQILSPWDLEQEFGLVGGDIFHGALSLNQLYSARPVLGHGNYRMPLKGLYLCGSGAHPGGGVSGIPGHNAAREILKDLSSFISTE